MHCSTPLTHSLTPRRYNPCRVLADSRRRLQPSMSLALFLQFLTPNFSASLITPSIHLRFGLPARLLPSGMSKVIFLHGRLPCTVRLQPRISCSVFRIPSEPADIIYQNKTKSFICVTSLLQCVPLATEPGISLIVLPLMRILQRNWKRTYLHCVRNVTTS